MMNNEWKRHVNRPIKMANLIGQNNNNRKTINLQYSIRFQFVCGIEWAAKIVVAYNQY